MCCLCTPGQGDYAPDPWTEARKTEVLAQLWAAAIDEADGTGLSVGHGRPCDAGWAVVGEPAQQDQPSRRSPWSQP
jgi:hypothetical protein